LCTVVVAGTLLCVVKSKPPIFVFINFFILFIINIVFLHNKCHFITLLSTEVN